MFSQVKLTKLVALFAAVIAMFCTVQTPAFAAVPIDMGCGESTGGIVIPASDEIGAYWVNNCGKTMEVVVDYAQGKWNYGSAAPYNQIVGPDGNPYGPVRDNFSNPTCRGAELSYVMEYDAVDGGCYSVRRSVFVEPYRAIRLTNNDAKGGYGDNSGSVTIEQIHNTYARY